MSLARLGWLGKTHVGGSHNGFVIARYGWFFVPVEHGLELAGVVVGPFLHALHEAGLGYFARRAGLLHLDRREQEVTLLA